MSQLRASCLGFCVELGCCSPPTYFSVESNPDKQGVHEFCFICILGRNDLEQSPRSDNALN